MLRDTPPPPLAINWGTDTFKQIDLCNEDGPFQTLTSQTTNITKTTLNQSQTTQITNLTKIKLVESQPLKLHTSQRSNLTKMKPNKSQKITKLTMVKPQTQT